MVDLDWRVARRKGRSDDGLRGNWVFDSEEMDKSSWERSWVVDSSTLSMSFGNFDKIPASNISALFLKNTIGKGLANTTNKQAPA